MLSTLKKINDLIVFKHTIFSLPFIFIAMILSSGGWFGMYLFLLCILATISARNFAMAFNRFLDRDIDILNDRTKNRSSVDGRLNSSFIIWFIILNGIVFIVNSYFINELSFYLSIPFLIIIGFYSWTKRWTYFAHLFLGIALGLAPIAGDIAVSGGVSLSTLALSLGVLFWVAGFDVIYSLADIDFDRKHNLFSIPARFGESMALKISLFFHILTILFWLMACFLYNASWILYIGVIICAFILAYEHYIVHQDTKNIDKAFFVVNGYLGFVFLIFAILEVIYG